MKNQPHLDFVHIIFTILTKYWYIWLLLISYSIIQKKVKSKESKGWLGEQKVRLILWWYLNKKKYHTFYNIYLKPKGGSAQIDHIIVSVYGIFVIETKNMSGSIEGKDYNDHWYQELRDQKIPFYNPLWQNDGHIKAITETLTKTEKDKFHSIVIFTNDNCKFKTKMPDNVLLKGYIKYIKSKTEKILTEKEVANTIEGIKVYRKRNNYKTKKEHIEYIKNTYTKP